MFTQGKAEDRENLIKATLDKFGTTKSWQTPTMHMTQGVTGGRIDALVSNAAVNPGVMCKWP